MKAEDTVLEGCEIICFEGESGDYVTCPLPKEEQAVCKQRRQYEAGMKEVVDWVEDNVGWRPDAPYKSAIDMNEWKVKLKEWGLL